MSNLIFEITEEYIELYKALKFNNLAESGGQAKYLISEGLVLVNGAVEKRKRKKIIPGDVIELDGQKIEVKSSQNH